MLRYIAGIAMRNEARQKAKRRQRNFLNWDRVQRVAIILDGARQTNKQALDLLIESMHKYVEVFYVETRSKLPSFSDWHCFTRKDRNALLLPNKKIVGFLRERKFDLVINAAVDLFADAVLVYLPATLKCGRRDGFGDTDLVITEGTATEATGYLQQVITYLKMIRNE
jgi:hypothetical protein